MYVDPSQILLWKVDQRQNDRIRLSNKKKQMRCCVIFYKYASISFKIVAKLNLRLGQPIYIRENSSLRVHNFGS